MFVCAARRPRRQYLNQARAARRRLALATRSMDDLEPIEVRRYSLQGPTVVVLHGGPGAPGSASGLARILARAFHVLEPLQRRSGRVPLTVSRHVEDLAVVAPRPVT